MLIRHLSFAENIGTEGKRLNVAEFKTSGQNSQEHNAIMTRLAVVEETQKDLIHISKQNQNIMNKVFDSLADLNSQIKQLNAECYCHRVGFVRFWAETSRIDTRRLCQ